MNTFGYGLLFVLLSGLCLAIFTATSSPTVGFIDSGELAAVIHTLGISHPTGYSLYTILGRCIAILFGSDNLVRCLNLSSCVLLTLSWVFFSLTVCLELGYLFSSDRRLNESADGGARSKIVPGGIVPLWLCLSASLVFPFSRMMWQQAVITEVYPLSTFLFVILVFLARIVLFPSAISPGRVARLSLLLALTLGFSFCNHYFTPITLVPLIIVFSVLSPRVRFFLKRHLILILLFILLGWSLWLYLPLRSHLNPVFDWGNPSSAKFLLRHVTGRQYQVWMFRREFQELFSDMWRHTIGVTTGQIPAAFLLFTLPGLWHLQVHSRRFLFFLLLLFAINIFYTTNYDIPDIDPYTTPAVFVYIFITSLGIARTGAALGSHILPKTGKCRRIAVTGLAIMMAIPMIHTVRSNRFYCDRSRNTLARDWAYYAMDGIPEGSLIITDVWFFYSPSIYLRYVGGGRSDLVVVDIELLRRSWYYNFLKENYPRMWNEASSEIGGFLEELHRFEEGLPYDPSVIEKRYIEMINAFVGSGRGEGEIFLILSTENPKIAPRWKRIPHGYITRLVPPGIEPETSYSLFDPSEIRHLRDSSIYRTPQGHVMLARILQAPFHYGLYYSERKDYDAALRCFRDSIALNPSSVPSLHNAALAAYLGGKEDEAISFMERALRLDPHNTGLSNELCKMRLKKSR